MFPWAVAYLEVGPTAFFDMFVFAAILGVGLLSWASQAATCVCVRAHRSDQLFSCLLDHVPPWNDHSSTTNTARWVC
jgi:hypothetical protein